MSETRHAHTSHTSQDTERQHKPYISRHRETAASTTRHKMQKHTTKCTKYIYRSETRHSMGQDALSSGIAVCDFALSKKTCTIVLEPLCSRRSMCQAFLSTIFSFKLLTPCEVHVESWLVSCRIRMPKQRLAACAGLLLGQKSKLFLLEHCRHTVNDEFCAAFRSS